MTPKNVAPAAHSARSLSGWDRPSPRTSSRAPRPSGRWAGRVPRHLPRSSAGPAVLTARALQPGSTARGSAGAVARCRSLRSGRRHRGPLRSSTPPQCRPDRQPAARAIATRGRVVAVASGRGAGADSPPTPITDANRGGTGPPHRAPVPTLAADERASPGPRPAPADPRAPIRHRSGPTSAGPASRAGPPCTAASPRRRWCASGCARCRGSPGAGRSPASRRTCSRSPGSPPPVARLAVAAQGGRWPLAAAALVVLAGVLDGLDGAVALHTGRARPLGAVVDAVADRLGDLLLVATLAVLGAPPAWCVAAAALTMLHEYLRARAGAAGMPGVGALTVAERPTRLVAGGGRLPGRRHPARRHPADGLGLGDGVRDRLGRGRRRRARPAVGRGGPHDPAPVSRRRPCRPSRNRSERGAQAGPTRSATIFADSATIGSPPPGCADPPTRYSPGTGDRLAGRSSAASGPCEAVP